MNETPLKGTIKHKLTMLKANPPIQQLTQDCILANCEPDVPEPWYAAARLQLSIRCQYYRAIEKDPSRALHFTYALNCPPSGFHVKPMTDKCFYNHICPWCFSRRLVSIYDALMRPEPKIRNLHDLLV
ncbi:hypothetical protein EC9_29400 [Rosistilla ulvae]|uniref:Uncharacterized protein n=1 Tax=Rosistilla ulvae TaxID=1930277 RepID=A0A517M1K2_9BACT|nr:hypothetical protein EC9_29400 [Rosistilla ulvae]